MRPALISDTSYNVWILAITLKRMRVSMLLIDTKKTSCPSTKNVVEWARMAVYHGLTMLDLFQRNLASIPQLADGL